MVFNYVVNKLVKIVSYLFVHFNRRGIISVVLNAKLNSSYKIDIWPLSFVRIKPLLELDISVVKI